MGRAIWVSDLILRSSYCEHSVHVSSVHKIPVGGFATLIASKCMCIFFVSSNRQHPFHGMFIIHAQ